MARDTNNNEFRHYAQAFCAQTEDVAPLFKAKAFDTDKKEITDINLKQFQGSWVILFFYPSDFTFV